MGRIARTWIQKPWEQTQLSGASEGTRWYEYITYVLALGFHVIGGNILVTFRYGVRLPLEISPH